VRISTHDKVHNIISEANLKNKFDKIQVFFNVNLTFKIRRSWNFECRKLKRAGQERVMSRYGYSTKEFNQESSMDCRFVSRIGFKRDIRVN